MMKAIKMQSVKNFEKRVKVAGLSFVVKKSDKICPIHKTQMVYTDKSPQPFCIKCQHEAVEKRKKELDRTNSVQVIRKDLRQLSLVDDPKEYSYTFDNFKAPSGSKEAQMKDVARKLAGEYYKDRNLNFNTVLYGTPGQGKTHLAMAMLNAVNKFSNPPQRCLFVNVTSLFLAIRSSFDNPMEKWTEQFAVHALSNADLLVIDDLGSESVMSTKGEASQFVQRVLYQVTNGQKRIIITTNLTMSELRQAYNAKLVSRLLAGSKGSQLDFSGIKDKRY